LGGGGSLGAVQVGMLQALTERGVKPDVIVGTSVGSLNGAMVALDPASASNRLAHAWARITDDQVFPGGALAQVWTLRRSKTHLFPNTELAKVIASFLGGSTAFADLALPFAAVAMDVDSARPHVMNSGSLTSALLASAAIPLVFPPVERDGRRLYDGGVVDNVPLRQALSMGAGSLIVLDCNFPGHVLPPPQSPAETVLFAVTIMMRRQAVLEAPIVAAQVPVVYLPGPVAHRISPLHFGHTEALIEEAYDASRAFLDGLEVDGPGLYGSPS
jgi:NTE family protein